MKKFVIGIGAVLLAFFLGARLIDWFKSDEDRIRTVVTQMVAGFNDAAPKRTVGGLDEAFRDPQSGFDREQIQEGLRFLVLRHQGKMPWKCTIVNEAIEVSVEGNEASAIFTLDFRENRGDDGDASVWQIAITAGFIKSGSAWAVTKIDRETLDGAWPF